MLSHGLFGINGGPVSKKFVNLIGSLTRDQFGRCGCGNTRNQAVHIPFSIKIVKPLDNEDLSPKLST